MLPAGGNPVYYVEDLLGTSRLITQNNGTVCYDADFDPYGGEHAYTNTCAQNYKFEGKERDTETGNDDFGARSYSSRFGRWLSADWSSTPVPVPYANLTNPQTLNLYAMVSDDPETSADLDGHTQQASAGLQAPEGINPGTGELSGGLGCDDQPESCQTKTEEQDQAKKIKDEDKKKQEKKQRQEDAERCVQYGCGGGTPKKRVRYRSPKRPDGARAGMDEKRQPPESKRREVGKSEWRQSRVAQGSAGQDRRKRQRSLALATRRKKAGRSFASRRYN
jgi:RHS repeat-associated protein